MPRRGDICQEFNSSMFRYYLRKKYKTRQPFAKRMGLSSQAIDAWATGKSKPTWKHLIKAAEIFNISPRQLLYKRGRKELEMWEDHLIDFLMSPPELRHEKIIKIIDDTGSVTEKKVERELKLTTKEAIELTEKLGIFEAENDDETEEPNPLYDMVREKNS